MIRGVILFIWLLGVFALEGYSQSCNLSASVSSSSPAICSGNAVTITATGSGSTGTYTYLWNTGETTKTISATSPGTYTVTIKTNSAACAGTSKTASVTLASSTSPEAPIASGTIICANTTATLNASGNTGNFKWYDAAVGGNQLATGSVFTTEALSATSTFYVAQVSAGGCESARTAVEVTVKPAPNAPYANDVSICQGNSITLTANGAANYQWYDTPAGGNLISTNQSFTTPVLSTTTKYYVQTTGSECVSSRTVVTVNVNAMPEKPVVTEYTICEGSRVNLSVNNIIDGYIYQWYDVASGGTPLITSVDFTTPALTTSSTFYVQAILGSCTSPRVPIRITVNPFPQNPIASGMTICAGSSVILTASGSFGNYEWFDTSFGDTPIATGTSFKTPVLNYTTTYFVQASAGGCSSKRTAVKVVINSTPFPPSAPGQVICYGGTATLTASAQTGTFEWYDAPAGGNVVGNGVNFTTPALTQDATYYVQNVVAGCVGTRAEVKVTVLPKTASPVVGGVTICEGNSAVLSASGNSIFKWYDQASGGNLLASSNVFVTPLLNSTTTYFVAAENEGCVSDRTPVTVTVTAIPQLPVVADAKICPGATAILSASGNGTMEWYDAATGGNLLHAGNTFTVPSLITDTVFYAQAANGQCVTDRVPVNVKIISNNGPAFSYPKGTYCVTETSTTPVIHDTAGGTFSASPSTLAIDPVTGKIDIGASPVGKFNVIFNSNGQCHDITTTLIEITTTAGADFHYDSNYCQDAEDPYPTFPTSGSNGTFTAMPAGLVFKNDITGEIDLHKSAAGTYVITNTVSTACGSDIKTATVTIEPRVIVNAGPDQTVALGAQVQLAGTFSVASGVTWSGGSGIFSDPSSPRAIYTPASGETDVKLTLTSTKPAGICNAVKDEMVIHFRVVPNAPVAAGATICTGSQVTLAAVSPGGNYEWFDAPAAGNFLHTGATFTTPVLTNTSIFYVQTTVNGFASERSPVTITVNPSPADPKVTSAAVCFGTSTTLTASGSSGKYEWFDAPAGGNRLWIGPTYTTTTLLTNTTYYVQASNGNCSSGRVKADITVNSLPVVTSAPEVNACSNYPVGYKITSDAAGATFVWSREVVANISNAAVSGQTSSVINESLVNTSGSPVNVTYFITPTGNGCGGGPFRLVVTVYPAVSVTSAPKQTICNNSAPGYTITFKNRPGFVSWSRDAVAGISNAAVQGQQARTIREILTNTTSSAIDVKYDYIIYSDYCPPITFQLTVTVDPTIVITGNSRGNDLCSGEIQHYKITANNPNATFSWTRSATREITNQTVSKQSDLIDEALFCATPYPYTVQYFITPYYNGCAGVPFVYNVTVYPIPLAPAIASNSPVCVNSTISLSTPSEDGLTYLWTGPNGFKSTSSNPMIPNATKANEGVYSLFVTRRNCTSEVSTTTIKVNDPPIAYAGNNQTLCTTVAAVQLSGKIGGGTTTGIWSSNGTGSFSSNTQLDGLYMPSSQDRTAGSVVLTLTSTSADDCVPASSSMTITFMPTPLVDAGNDMQVCIQDETVTVNGTTSAQAISYWTSSGTGTFASTASPASAVYIPSSKDKKNGSVKLMLHAANATCTNDVTDDLTLTFVAPPTVRIDREITLIKKTTVKLNPVISEDKIQYLWAPAKYISDVNVKDPIITATENITYTLTVTDARGCVTVSEVNVKVLDAVEAPNTFTPNGDGINDEWKIPSLKDYPNATIDIFSRYGEKVFHADNNTPTWDGTRNGEKLPAGAYYFIIDTKFEKKVLSGPVTIIR